MIVLNVINRCKPGLRNAFLERLRAEGIGAASRADEGNLKYDYYIPVDDDSDVLLVEKWQDADALKKHGEQPHFARLMAFKPEYVSDTIIDRFEV